jgi:hypothetical protein
MKIVFKTNENGVICLYDTRSNKFFENGCVKDEESGSLILKLANEIADKPTKTIIEIARSHVYGDNGYLNSMLAEKYLELNPDLQLKSHDILNLKKDKKSEYKKKK